MKKAPILKVKHKKNNIVILVLSLLIIIAGPSGRDVRLKAKHDKETKPLFRGVLFQNNSIIARASSDKRSIVQAGSQTMRTSTLPVPSTKATASATC